MIGLNDGNEKSIWPKIIGVLITIIVISPFMISVLSIWAKPLTFIEFDSSVWIGFWGSYLGGIIGTIGVIYVAQLQNKKHQEENEKMMIEQRKLNQKQIEYQNFSLHKTEKDNRKRLSIQTKLEMLNEFKKSLHIFKREVDDYKRDYLTLIEAVNNYNFSKEHNYKLLEAEKNLNNIKNRFTSIGLNYFADTYKTIELNSSLLSNIQDIDFVSLTFSDGENFKNLDQTILSIKTDNIETLSAKTNIFAMDEETIKFSLPFVATSESLRRAEEAVASSQKVLLDKLDEK